MSATAPITQDVMTIPRKQAEGPVNLVGLTRDAMRAALIAEGTPEKQAKMRVGQIWQWIYQWGTRDFADMTNLSKAFRAELAEKFVIEVPEVVTKQVSEDGTRKYLVRIAGGHEVEVVYIPEEGRGTLCVSSQVGCTLTCSFCHTGTQKLVRNLTAAEIIGQVMVARDDLGEWPVPGTLTDAPRLLSNIVLMGMGEPLYNFENVRDAMKIAMDPEGIQLSRRRITLSTSGVVPEIARTAEEIGCQLAVSFHATTDEVRNKLVPINKRWNIAELIEALRAYPKVSNSERITFEYVMLDGVNDSDADAHRLIELIRGIPAKINLIPFNEWPGAPYKRSSNNRIRAFSEIVYQAGYASPVRKPRGEDIMAACGQLKSATERERKSRKQIEADAGM
ncbi:MAG: 23S rRNA (adenine(2503)-C(2))-methyltransferase RlmN [Roseobacter sp.]|jgi:23S rRNA (adenine2503-C2)-methyltransferase|uniref:Dual-specificity RNA methyltransferase RlmN n=4 Tax=Sulfitobacter TaxID=60136 RepID=A0AAX3A7D9_9RHOB|nr:MULTISPECIES: 23S rRNA (adenine(2503)-C(2))-methyltransferase RlmN [Sulfitobacter]MBG62407.1 23S rRNA (adenine(2503)-C(2))-methyltransferase RlmN [Roseobacter sp.]HBM39752.1 23S rRNA (adenine(2503)-C(2))-methyltransferase RlmN [Sulfitobacter sp.]MCF7746302.1 23S rRNA (adenine(2503)-C(2))-methyltransferase RlmN [Sulfitobacter sp. M39]PTB00223.1 23S rRNA (adenine(2503)-C(2))-methyltransferase RlmN [Sulfitobacter sp. CB-A]QLL41259.1 23S rRNA (adenine(2503)-C(2))-methyltransferase RlmN [Sulfito|tara:strand:- start:3105 stop:4280 length:1176 start_codon:yes stop_codon:yes gene_type:complete